MDEIETISSNKDTTDATSQKRGDDCNRGDEPRRCALECLIKAVDHLELSKVECAQRALRNGHIYLLALTPESFNNPTDYEKQQVKRAREISLKCVSGPPLCGVILLDQMDSDQDDHLYISFTIAFGALAFKLQEHNMAIEVFNLVMNSNDNDSPPHREIKVDFEFSVVVAKANLGCVYLILGQLEKAKEILECALKSLERFRLDKNIGNVEVEIFAVENNLSLVLQGQQNYTEAITLQNDLVAKAKHLRLPFRMVSAMHYNRAELFLELEYPVKALKVLRELKSLSEFVDDENGIPEEFISSKICLVHLSMKEVALAEEIAVKLSLSPSFSFSLPSISSSWLPTSSSLSSSSLTSSSLSTSLSSSSSSSSSSSLASSSSSSSSSPPSSPPPSSSEFQVFPKSNGKLPWDFSAATLANLVDFYLYQENVQRVSMILDLCVSNWKETFGESHPAFASLLYRQGVKFSLMRQNVSSKNCFEEALSIFTRSGFALTHPEVSKCNAGLARLLFCESSQDEMFLSSQSIPRTPSDSDEGWKKSQELIFSDSITSSSLFEKLVKQIIKNQEKFGEISELVMTKHLLKIQGPSVGQITVWLHDRSIKMTTQPTHAKKSLAANYEESFSSDRTNINEILIEEMKVCASALGVSFETFTETSLCPSRCQTPGEPLMNHSSNVKAMTKASNGGQNSFEDGEAGASASFSTRGMAEKVLENPCISLLPRTMTDQKLISGEKFSFPSHGQNNEEEPISAEIAPCCSFSKVDEKKAKEDSVVLSIRDFSQYRHGESRAMKEEPYTTSKPKRKAASDQSTYESHFSPVTLKAVKGQTLMNRAQQVTGTHEHSSVKPYVDDDQQENFADDVTDGVSTFQFCPPEGITEEQDHNKEQERKLQTSNQECHGKEKVVNIERSPNQDGVKRMDISRSRKERQSLAYWKENDANNSFCGEDVADNGNAKHVVEVRGACGYQNKDFQNADTPKESKDDSHERGSTKKPIESLGLKGGRRDEFSANNSSLCAANIPCISESSHLGIKSGFLARHSNDNSMSCSVDETDYEGILDCTNFCQFPDCAECSTRDTATSSITALRSPAQSFLNFNSYQPEQSLPLPYNSKYSSPKNKEILSLPPPPPPRRPQFPSLPYNVPQERHYVSQTDFDTGAFQSRTWHSVDPGASNSSTWFGGFTTPENGTGLGGQNTGINQREIRRSAFPVHLTSNTPDLIYEQAERAMRQRERERIKRETATARVSTDGDSTTTQPSLPNSNAETTSDDDSLAALERRVAEACSMVERVLKEREEKEKAIKEREQRQREERAKRELQEQESRARESRETMQRNGNGEGTSTGSEEEAPSQRVALPENPQWLCEHYQRLCRVKFPCCGRFYPCHRCHNNSGECENDHCKAKEAFYIECSVCRHQQEINRDAHTCARCNTRMSAYFCAICKHFTGEDKHPYHCTKCGICRIHKDRSFHCDVCNVCLDKRLQGKHKCRPDSGHDECCICLEDAFSGCQILPCSHKVHRECAIAMIQNGVRNCPICRHPLYSRSTGTE